MEVQRETALEVFGLKEGFTQEELNKAFRKLSKVTHPDTGGDDNLFRFIMSCKETLSKKSSTNNSKTQTQKGYTHQPKQEAYNKKSEKEEKNIYLNTLYKIYRRLHEYTSEYDIIEILGSARVYITPCRKKKESKSFNIQLEQSFKEFQNLGFAKFATTIVLPETFRKFKYFDVRVEFMGDTFNFILSMKSPFHIVKYRDIFEFNSIIELNFE